MYLDNERQSPTQDPKIQGKLLYFLIEVEFINIFVTGYVVVCLEPAYSSKWCCPWHGYVKISLYQPLVLNVPLERPDLPSATGHKAQTEAVNSGCISIVVVRALKFL